MLCEKIMRFRRPTFSMCLKFLTTRAMDLELKLCAFKAYYNQHRTHAALNGTTPIETTESKGLDLKSYRWQTHCRSLYQTPIAA